MSKQPPPAQGHLTRPHQRTAAGGGGGMGNVAPLPGGPGRGPPSFPPLFMDAATPKLMVPSRSALAALLLVPLALWGVAVAVGIAHAEPLPEGTAKGSFEHPLSWFDRHVFRVWGPLLPLAPLLVRLAALRLRLPPSPRGSRPPLRPCPSLALQALCMYGAVIAVRLGLYLSHVAAQRHAGVFLVSDHLLLAASVVACFQAELVLCVSDVYKCEVLREADPGAGGVRQVAVVAALVCSMFALVFVCGDMYCTARWFHHPAESVGALAAGAVLFQAPVGLWLWRRAHRPPGRV
ncbi:hypothetical protein HYH03_002396 [Edaphochlamys debaryana]|uniref:Uncharacterized protein n=1 Tax=Edaphochlamys debaryana TaxID=47281 RepID=A0A836C547_9CHLO|nr:hypothetical protein HYH03_002396 [Edaphochlamys debaryana]|eukprot:KAG2499449.1 hypothetical protein HYH03_002396 [Edaphochlamys debaryana]